MNMNFLNISPNLAPIDLAIIIAYLALTVAIGLYYGRGIKTFKEFAVGNQRFGTATLTMTIFATIVGGNVTVGLMEKIYTFGLVFVFVMFCGNVYYLILARYIAPQIVRFKALSLGDLIQQRFGIQGKVVSGIASAFLMIGGLGAQITALGLLSDYLIGVPFVIAVIAASLIVVFYSAYGGVKSVVMTDILQFFLLIVAIPIICLVGLYQIGGYEPFFEQIPKHLILPQQKDLLSILSLCVVFLVPLMPPEDTHRLLLSKDSNVLSKAFQFAAILRFPLYCVILILALVAFGAHGVTSANQAFPYILSLLPPVVKGFALAGIMAVIMSTADTILNSGSVFIMNDLIKPLFRKYITKNNELFWTRCLTLVLGLLPIYAALKYKNVFDVALFGRIFWMPIILTPLYAILFDLPGGLRDFYRAAVAGISTFLIWSFLPLPFLADSAGAWVSLEKFTYINALLPVLSHLCDGLFIS